MKKPKRCCGMGTYEHTIPMPIKGRRQDIDFCIADIVTALNATNIETEASCCGHNKIPGSIILSDGREIIIVKNAEERNKIFKIFYQDLLSGKKEVKVRTIKKRRR